MWSSVGQDRVTFGASQSPAKGCTLLRVARQRALLAVERLQLPIITAKPSRSEKNGCIYDADLSMYG